MVGRLASVAVKVDGDGLGRYCVGPSNSSRLDRFCVWCGFCWEDPSCEP